MKFLLLAVMAISLMAIVAVPQRGKRLPQVLSKKTPPPPLQWNLQERCDSTAPCDRAALWYDPSHGLIYIEWQNEELRVTTTEYRTRETPVQIGKKLHMVKTQVTIRRVITTRGATIEETLYEFTRQPRDDNAKDKAGNIVLLGVWVQTKEKHIINNPNFDPWVKTALEAAPISLDPKTEKLLANK